MKKPGLYFGIALLLAGAFLSGLFAISLFEQRRVGGIWNTLKSTAVTNPGRYQSAMVESLPEPVRRYFNYTIESNTPLRRVAEVQMRGDFSLGTKEDPDYMPLSASELLAAPRGYIWSMHAGDGLMRISGSDGTIDCESWSRFRLWNLLSVANIADNIDHRRSSFGRYIAESVLWTPAVLLSGEGIIWQAIDENTAQVTVNHQDLSQSVLLRIDEEGKPLEIEFPRWSDANKDKAYQLQPFGGYLSEFKDFGGYRLATKLEAGNQFGTEHYFPFIRVRIEDIHFPGADR